MIRARIDRCFLRFRRHGDPRQLATVFDLAAPELWRVAAHLCRDRHEAEDAVQNTFLAAIESKEAWEGHRPLLPWLVGLLVNRAREQRRVRARVVDAARLDAPEVIDPATAAGERELGAACVAALASVSEPFRSVVEQHFVHGRTAAEIAAATGIPAATVRTRLHRGLEQLRKKLPVGAVVGSLVPLQLPAASLASMRAVVLSRVPGGATVFAGAAVSFAGMLAAAKSWGGLVAVGLGIVLWWVVGPGAEEPAVNGDGTMRPAPVVASTTGAPAARSGDGDPAAAASESLVHERALAPAVDPAATVALLVRNAATKAPLADVQVRLMREQPRHSRAASPATDAAESVPVATSVAMEATVPESADGRTDAEGRAVLRIAAGRVRVWVGSGLPTNESLHATAAVTTDHTVDVAPVFDADVKVVDAHGAPVADAGIFADDRLPVMREIGRTDRDGRWREPRTELRLLVRGVRDGLVASPASLLTARSGCVVLQLGGEAATIHGRVLDAAGAPVPAAVILFVADDVVGSSALPNTARSDADGRYRCDWLAPGGHQLLVRDQRDAKAPRLLMASATAVIGASSATDLQYDQGASLQVRLERHDGQPVVGHHSVQLVRKRTEIPVAFAPWCHLSGEIDARGTCVFRDLLPGRYELEARYYGATVHEEVEVRAGQAAAFEHRFAELMTLQIVVVDEHEQPRAGILVMRKVDRAAAETRTTDAKGRVWFELLARGEYDITLATKAEGPVVAHHRVSTGDPVRIVLPTRAANGRVLGRVVMPRGELPAGLRLSLHRDVGNNPFHAESMVVTFDAASGAFHCDELPAGRYGFSAVTMEPFANLAQRVIDVTAAGTADLGVVELGSGEIHIDVRMAGADPGRVHAAVRPSGFDHFAGEPRQANAVLPIRRQHLSPGAYRVLVWGENVLPAFADAIVAIDQVASIVVDLQRGVRTEVRLPGSIGTITVHCPDGTVVREMVFELRSWVRGLQPGPHRVEYTDFAGKRYEAAFVVGAANDETVELRPLR